MVRNAEELKGIKEGLEEALNFMLLLGISLAENEGDRHVVRSLHVLQRMVNSVMDKVGMYEIIPYHLLRLRKHSAVIFRASICLLVSPSRHRKFFLFVSIPRR